jgi:endonuclease YncB( thermonuclease family)
MCGRVEFVRAIGDELQSRQVLPVLRRRWRQRRPRCRGGKAVPARLTICSHAKPIDCMVDGHTVWMAGTKIHITNIDTPKSHPPRCAREARLGQAATLKMHPFLNAGPFTLTPIKRDVDRYGRKLRIVERGGESLGAVLVSHGLARRYGGGKRSP